MKALALPVAVIATIAIATLGAQDPAPATDKAPHDASPEKWTHLALERDATKGLSDPEFAAKINGLGADGWELVSVLNHAKDGTTTKTVYYFKKPL
jgi:hypothetical protein